MPAVEGKETGSDSVSVLILDDASTGSEVAKLRGRWELASVLNFISVFEPMIGNDLKLTAEDIELGLVKPNASIAALHVKLLKGTPPVSKLLNSSDAWVTALCKKLAMWWPWVAEGEIPLTACNGEEIWRYKELDPTSRLLLLKALCEIRADQVDIVSYINDVVKSNKDAAGFRKEKLGGNGNVSYWYDGNTISGYRLYREVKRIEPQKRAKGKACLTVPITGSHWETVAVDLEEFRQVVDVLCSSKTAAEVAIGKTISAEAIPVVEKFHKKKERAVKRKRRQEMLLKGLRSSAGSGITRSCRNRRPISYTFDEYDRAIEEAIEVTNSIGSDTEDDKLQEAGDESNEDGNDDYSSKKDDDDKNESYSDNSAGEENNMVDNNHEKKKNMPRGSRWSNRLAGNSGGTKNMLRQRPVVNSAIVTIVSDSEDDISLEHTNSDADPEEVSDKKFQN